jgi:3D (Asp-Asp-Asp) domain-containing protein
MTRARLGLFAVWSCAACAPGEITTFVEPSGTPDSPVARPDSPAAVPDSPVATPDGPVATPDGPVATPDAGGGGPGPLLGTFKLTYYYVANEADYSGAKDTSLYEPTCDVLAVVPAAFAHDVIIEGTGALDDGRVFNYAGSCSCALSPCFRFVDAQHPWGNGAGGRALVPFRSVAVDRTVLTIGQHYYVAELDGVTMPGDPPTGGFVHDGCVSADDTGGAIIGMHIDFFSALRAYYLTLDRELNLNNVTIYEGGDRCP